jgi:hypothetical protein
MPKVRETLVFEVEYEQEDEHEISLARVGNAIRRELNKVGATLTMPVDSIDGGLLGKQHVQAWRARYESFMRLDATAHQIHMFLSSNRLTRGVDWTRSKKTSMAEHYAYHEYQLTEAVFIKLRDQFGTKEK